MTSRRGSDVLPDRSWGWLKKRVDTHKIGRLVILATPRMLGVLRRFRPRLSNGLLQGLEGNLMRLEAGQLADHPMVRDLVKRD